MSQVRPGVLIAIIVFAVFAAYAYLAPATYRASALMVVDMASPAGSTSLPEPLEAARRLSEAILDRKTLERLSRERANSASPEAQAQAAGSVRQGLMIDTSDERSFSIAYRDSEPARTQRACNELARRAVEVAPSVLVDHSAERAVEARRQERTRDLAAFMAAHPEVASEPPPSTDRPSDHDTAFSALNAEKVNLEARLNEVESGAASDNPYREPREFDPNLLRRRLGEINNALAARRPVSGPKTSAVLELSPALRAEWKRVLEAVTQSSAEAQVSAAPSAVARLAVAAALPSSPVEPNRRLFLFFGLVFGVGLGTTFTLAMRTTQKRRRSSVPPAPAPAPAPSQTHPTMQLPSSPLIPSGLGPAVPLTPIGAASRPAALALSASSVHVSGKSINSGAVPFPSTSNQAPPIVPTPQRIISSGPPPAVANAVASALLPTQKIRLGPETRVTEPSSRPPVAKPPSKPPRPFASTLVLPPDKNPSPNDDRSADSSLVSANQAWDQQIRAHEVPGFAVVSASSEPPAPVQGSALPATAYSVRPDVATAHSPSAASGEHGARAAHPMKVTQPLGSFVTEVSWREPHGSAPAPHAPASTPGKDFQYSYVSTDDSEALRPAKGSSSPVASPSKHEVVRVQDVAITWRPDQSLTPDAQRALCEQLYTYAVENCVVLSVVAVPQAYKSKSRVASEIALALAASGHPRILLVEGDLQRPSVQRLIGVDVPMATGFSQQLNVRAQGSNDESWTVLGCSQSLHVLAEGVMRSPGSLLSRYFADCVTALRSYYDFVVIDGPTVSLDMDSGALNAVTDGLIIVRPARGSESAAAHIESLFRGKRFSKTVDSP